jgi:hypothetical protein
MAYCGPRGIAYEDFVEWGQLSQDLALAWNERERTRCPGCGTHPADWDESRGGDVNAWYADLHRCLGCEKRGSIESPEGQKGYHRVLVPNLDLPMWSHLLRE